MQLNMPIPASILILVMIFVSGTAAVASDRIKIDQFWIDQTEVTIGEFRNYTQAKAITTSAEREGGGFEYMSGWTRRPGWLWSSPYGVTASAKEPVVHVSWFEARDYCRHVGGRLPSFSEWRKAAYTEMRKRPTDGFKLGRTYRYPVGDTPDGMNNSRERHVEAGTTKRGVNGLYDMGANVWEWTADRRGDDAMTAGGSWWYGPSKTQASGAQWKPAAFFAIYVGFRCVYDKADWDITARE